MTRHFNKYQCSILGVERVPKEETHKYGIVHPLPFATRISNVDSIVEKPKPENAPSNLAVVGRYILTPRIFDLLQTIPRGAGNEIQLTDGIAALLGEEQRHDFATALEDTTACVVTLDELRSLMRERSELNLFFMRMFGARQLEMERRLESLVFRDSRSRIVEFLVSLVKNKGQRVGYEWVVRQFLTHQEIANLTATSRQTVTTTLNDLRFKKLLTFNRSRLLVRDLEKLEMEVRNG
jgi:hypothetical protein